MRSVSLALAVFCAFGVSRAGADIVFINCGDNEKEIKRAYDAATARGEELHVISPVVDVSFKERVNASRTKAQKVHKETQSVCSQSAASPGPCNEARAKYLAVFNEHQALLNSVPKMNGTALTNALAQLKAEKANVSSVIISGHDGDREFWGTYADLTEADIEKAFLANKPIGNGIKSLYLWGCYSATTDDFIKGWKKAFPPTAMVAGFIGQAPLGTRKESGALLEDLLLKEKGLLETRDRNELKRIFESLGDVNRNVAICLDRGTIVSRKGVRTIDEDIRACAKSTTEEDRQTKIYRCYLRAEDRCPDVPNETDERSPLRAVYDYFQEVKHCEEVLEQLGTPRVITALAVRRLLFDKTVRKNFERHHKAELDAMNALMDELGIPKHLRMRGLDGKTRREYLDMLRAIKREWNARTDALKDSDGLVHDKKTIALGNYIEEVQKLEVGSCVPISWVEEDHQLRDSSCGIKQGMQTAMTRAENEIVQIEADEAPKRPNGTSPGSRRGN